MDNKGQSLVVFVLLLPIIFILIALVWEVGNLSVEESRCENEIEDTIQYGLNHMEEANLENKLYALLSSNIQGDIDIKVDNKITIHVKRKVNNLTSINKKYDIDLTYVGYKENNQNIINKVRG